MYRYIVYMYRYIVYTYTNVSGVRNVTEYGCGGAGEWWCWQAPAPPKKKNLKKSRCIWCTNDAEYVCVCVCVCVSVH